MQNEGLRESAPRSKVEVGASFAGALWLYTLKLYLSPDDCSLLLGVDHRAIRALFESFHKFFVPLIDQLNDPIVVRGCSGPYGYWPYANQLSYETSRSVLRRLHPNKCPNEQTKKSILSAQNSGPSIRTARANSSANW